VDIMEISKPDDLGDIANLRLTHMEAKQLLARSQVSIDGGRGDAGMAKQDLYDTDVDTILDQPCRVGVAQAMRGDPALEPAAATAAAKVSDNTRLWTRALPCRLGNNQRGL
jgi:hypothetical protein